MKNIKEYNEFKNLYRKKEWFTFRDKILKRDEYKCYKCGNTNNLQVHHHVPYVKNKKPWEYELEECITLCKGCHAKEHKLIEPTSGWELIEINDLGDLSGECERTNCGQAIRYEHLAYHPDVGYKIVGSTCIEFLTEEDKQISSNVLYVYKKFGGIFEELKNSYITKKTKNNKNFLSMKYSFSDYKNFSVNLFFNFNKVKHLTISYRESKHNWDKKEHDFGSSYSVEETKYIGILLGIYYTHSNERQRDGLKQIINSLYKKD